MSMRASAFSYPLSDAVKRGRVITGRTTPRENGRGWGTLAGRRTLTPLPGTKGGKRKRIEDPSAETVGRMRALRGPVSPTGGR